MALSVSDGGETQDCQTEAQKGTPVLPHFQYTRVSFKLHMNRNGVKCFE